MLILVIGLYEDDQCIDKYQADGNRRQSEYAFNTSLMKC